MDVVEREFRRVELQFSLEESDIKRGYPFLFPLHSRTKEVWVFCNGFSGCGRSRGGLVTPLVVSTYQTPLCLRPFSSTSSVVGDVSRVLSGVQDDWPNTWGGSPDRCLGYPLEWTLVRGHRLCTGIVRCTWGLYRVCPETSTVHVGGCLSWVRKWVSFPFGDVSHVRLWVSVVLLSSSIELNTLAFFLTLELVKVRDGTPFICLSRGVDRVKTS